MMPGNPGSWLDYFSSRQYAINQLVSGEDLTPRGDACFNGRGQTVLKFSRSFIHKKDELALQGYHLKGVKVQFFVSWKKENSDEELKILLPEVVLEKSVYL